MPSTLSAATYAPESAAADELMVLANASALDHVEPTLYRSLISATRMIDDALGGMWFMPRVETQYFNAPNMDDDGNTAGLDLLLPMPLIELTSVLNGDGSTLSDADYVLLPVEGPPYDTIHLKADGTQRWTASVSGDPVAAIQVSGVWSGTARRYLAGAWYSSDDTVATAINSATTKQVVVAAADGADEFGFTPRFSRGMLLRWTVGGNTEYLEVVGIETNTLTVRRGARGTTALSSVPQGTPIEIWQCNADIAYACARQAAFMEASRGEFHFSQTDGQGATIRLNGSLWDKKAGEIVRDLGSAGKSAAINILVV